jgi:hypothetical protein
MAGGGDVQKRRHERVDPVRREPARLRRRLAPPGVDLERPHISEPHAQRRTAGHHVFAALAGIPDGEPFAHTHALERGALPVAVRRLRSGVVTELSTDELKVMLAAAKDAGRLVEPDAELLLVAERVARPPSHAEPGVHRNRSRLWGPGLVDLTDRPLT